MGSITTADKAMSTEDAEQLYLPDNEREDLQQRFYNNTCFEVAQLQAVLNQLVENKVEAIKQEAAAAQETRHYRKFLLMRMIRSPGVMVRRLKRRGSSLSAENKPSSSSPAAMGSGIDQRQSGDRKRRKRTTIEGLVVVGQGSGASGGNGPNKGKRVNRQRIGSSSGQESPRYNPGIYHDGTPQHSDDDIVFLPSPCCCDTDGHTTVPVDPAFDSDYISVKIDEDDDEDMIYAPEPQPHPYHLPHAEAHHLHHHHHHQQGQHPGPHDPAHSWRHSCEMGGVGLSTLSGMNAHTDCSDDDEIKKADRRRHRRRRRRKRRRKEKLAAQQAALGHRQLPANLSTVAVSVDEVRVIDPDELSKKARLTIAVTACLLLFMCLLLVGVTLRMAPLIDEMDASK